MKFILYLVVAFILIISGCRAQHSYKSVEGKKKLKHYNSIQYGQKPGKK